MAKTTILNAEFEKFKTCVISSKVPVAQVNEMRISFYAGTSVMLALISEAQRDSKDQSEFDKMIQNIHDEVVEFAEIQVNSAFDA